MLPKKHRLQLRSEAPFFTFPYRSQSSHVRIHWRFDQHQSSAQAAVVVSKKVAPTAVERNRLKRVVRATLLPLLSSLPSELRIVVFPKSADADLVRAHLQELLTQRFQMKKKQFNQSKSLKDSR